MSGMRNRLVNAAVMAAAGAIAVFAPLPLAPSDGGLLGGPADRVEAVLASALAGAVLLPGGGRRRRSWLGAAVLGLVCAPVALTLSLTPEMAETAIARGAEAMGEQLLVALLGGLYVMVISGPIYAAGGL
ncbi:MAG: hypothetical protein AAGI51_05600, partial [Pseudomonadota bacterium]